MMTFLIIIIVTALHALSLPSLTHSSLIKSPQPSLTHQLFTLLAVQVYIVACLLIMPFVAGTGCVLVLENLSAI